MKPTVEEVLSEPAGQRLDAWAAEHVMGWRPVATDEGRVFRDPAGALVAVPADDEFAEDGPALFAPSRFWGSMGRMLGEYQWRRAFGCAVGLHPCPPPARPHAEVCATRTLKDRDLGANALRAGGKLSVFADTLPLAACRALLLVALTGGLD